MIRSPGTPSNGGIAEGGLTKPCLLLPTSLQKDLKSVLTQPQPTAGVGSRHFARSPDLQVAEHFTDLLAAAVTILLDTGAKCHFVPKSQPCMGDLRLSGLRQGHPGVVSSRFHSCSPPLHQINRSHGGVMHPSSLILLGVKWISMLFD